VGGKLAEGGGIDTDSDQFNGALERAYVEIDQAITVTGPPPPHVVTGPQPPHGSAVETDLTMRASKSHLRRGAKVRFSGVLRPRTSATVGAQVRLRFHKRGRPGFRTLDTATVRAHHHFRFAKVRVKRGAYRVVCPRSAHLQRSTATMRFYRRALH
jgi:hypothetical protein